MNGTKTSAERRVLELEQKLREAKAKMPKRLVLGAGAQKVTTRVDRLVWARLSSAAKRRGTTPYHLASEILSAWWP